MLPPDLPDRVRQLVSGCDPSCVADVFAAALELPGFLIAAAYLDSADGPWELDGWSVERVRWVPMSLSVAWVFRASCGDKLLKLPVLYRLDDGIPEGTVELDGEVQQTDDHWEALRSDVDHLAYPQVIRLTRRIGVFEVGEVLLLDTASSTYVRRGETVDSTSDRISVRTLLQHSECYETVHSWP